MRAVNELRSLSAVADLRSLRGKPLARFAGQFAPDGLKRLAAELSEVVGVLMDAAAADAETASA